jgi:hypothetical protein
MPFIRSCATRRQMEQTLSAWLAANPKVEAIPGRDLFAVARYLVPLEASLVQGCLVAAGIPAVLADAHLVRCRCRHACRLTVTAVGYFVVKLSARQ